RMAYGKSWPQFCDNHKRDSNSDEEKRKKLSAGECAGQRRVRRAGILAHNREHRINNKKYASEDAVWLSRSRAHEPQNREEDDAFKKGLVELRRMKRCQNPAQRGGYLRSGA